MTFWDHLDALRGVLIQMAVAVVAVAIIVFCAMPWIFDSIILAPCHDWFPTYILFDKLTAVWEGASTVEISAAPFDVQLINTQLASQFFIHLSLSIELALIIAFPLLIYLLWRFVAPALYPRERRHASAAFLAGNALFYLGMAAGYFLIFPLALRFLAGYQLSESIPNTITIESYIDNFMSILLVMGVTFEIPLLTWILGKFGLITRSFFRRYRRHAIVALVVAAAVITPTSDPFTLLAVFIPLFLLWELSAMLLKPDSAGISGARSAE